MRNFDWKIISNFAFKLAFKFSPIQTIILLLCNDHLDAQIVRDANVYITKVNTNVTFFGKTDTNAFLLNGQEKRL